MATNGGQPPKLILNASPKLSKYKPRQIVLTVTPDGKEHLGQ